MAVLKAKDANGNWLPIGIGYDSTPYFEYGTYTPTLAGIAVGTGGQASNTAKYFWIGGPKSGDYGQIFVTGMIQLGTSGFSVTGPVRISMPNAFTHQMPWNTFALGGAGFPGGYSGLVRAYNGTDLELRVGRVDQTWESSSSLSSTNPTTPAASDVYVWNATLIARRA